MTRPTTTELGQKLRDARAWAKMTQAQAAESAGIHQSHWSEYELGTVEPSITVLRRIARAVGTEARELL